MWNFSAGPAVMPLEVLDQLRRDLVDLDGTGVGILEHSHRQPTFDRVLEESMAACRTLGEIPDDYEILMLPGGATLQFSQIALNLLADGATADYPDTDVWSAKAIIEARASVKAHIAVIFEGTTFRYDHVPTDSEMVPTPGAAYLHYCSNNTVHGTRYPLPPKAAPGVPLVCDASSEIFGRPLDWAPHGLVYAAAQKNCGVAAMTIVIVRKDLVERSPRALPTMMSYAAHAMAGSRLNTPPTFAIHTAGLVFRWMIAQGGTREFDRRNAAKASLLYRVIDSSNGFYRGLSRPECRSDINVSFRLPSRELDARFAREAADQGFDGLAGHKDAGGVRASMYNALPTEAASALEQFMREFARVNG